MSVLVGQPAPAFSLPAAFAGEPAAAPVRTVSLSDYAGQWLALCWYPRDFSFVCPTELIALSDRRDEFADRECAVVGASTDSVYAHRAWLALPRDQNGVEGLRFPLLADAAHEVCRAYELLNECEGTAARALLLISPGGVVEYMAAHNAQVGRSVDETLRVLDALQSGEMCGSDWKPGRG